MQMDEVKRRLEAALDSVNRCDAPLLKINVHEVCVAGRLAMYLQQEFSDMAEISVDIEYSRDEGMQPKKLDVSPECAERKDGVVRPDVIVHHRGQNDQNILILELKKHRPTAIDPSGCDCERIRAFRQSKKYRYKFGAAIKCQTGRKNAGVSIAKWFDDDHPFGI